MGTCMGSNSEYEHGLYDDKSQLSKEFRGICGSSMWQCSRCTPFCGKNCLVYVWLCQQRGSGLGIYGIRLEVSIIIPVEEHVSVFQTGICDSYLFRGEFKESLQKLTDPDHLSQATTWSPVCSESVI